MPPKTKSTKKSEEKEEKQGENATNKIQARLLAQEQEEAERAEKLKKATKVNGCKWAKNQEKNKVDWRRECPYKETVMEWDRNDTHVFLKQFLLPPGRTMGREAADKMKKKIDFVVKHTNVDLRVDIEKVLDPYDGLGPRLARPGYIPTQEEEMRWEGRPTKEMEEAEGVKQFFAKANLKQYGLKLVTLGAACLDDLMRLAAASRAGMDANAAIAAAAKLSSPEAREEASQKAQEDLEKNSSWRPGEAARHRAAERAAAAAAEVEERERAAFEREAKRAKEQRLRAKRKTEKEMIAAAEAAEAAEKAAADALEAEEEERKSKAKKKKKKAKAIAKASASPTSPQRGSSKKSAKKSISKDEGGSKTMAESDNAVKKEDLGKILKKLRADQKAFKKQLADEALAREESGVVESEAEAAAREEKEAEIWKSFEQREAEIVAESDEEEETNEFVPKDRKEAENSVEELEELQPSRIADEVLKEAGMILESQREAFRVVCEEYLAAIAAEEEENRAAAAALANSSENEDDTKNAAAKENGNTVETGEVAVEGEGRKKNEGKQEQKEGKESDESKAD